MDDKTARNSLADPALEKGFANEKAVDASSSGSTGEAKVSKVESPITSTGGGGFGFGRGRRNRAATIDKATTGGDDSQVVVGDVQEYLRKEREGEAKFHRLSWPRMTICLIVEAIALGSLSQPKTFSQLGMVPAVILTLGIGVLATAASLYLGEVCIRYPGVKHFDNIGQLLGGRIGREIVAVCFVLQLFLVTASHVLTGTELWNALSNTHVCAVVFGVVSAILLFLLAIPPSFHDFAVLGYVDFISIIVAIIITGVGLGKEARNQPGGIGATDWHLWPKEDLTFYEAVLAITNIAFAYSFSICQPSFMSELARPQDYKKALISLGAAEIIIYTLTGALLYWLGGDAVQSPAILSAGSLQKAAWGVAIPVVFISGAINSQVGARYIHGRIFKGTLHGVFQTAWGWLWWLVILAIGTVFAFVIAEVVPFFSSLLGVISALFISGFSFYLPGLCYFMLLKDEEHGFFSMKRLPHTICNLLLLILGFFLLGAG